MQVDREFPMPVRLPKLRCINPDCFTTVRVPGFCAHCERQVEAERVLLRVKKAEATQ
jgi:hypothetical protein